MFFSVTHTDPSSRARAGRLRFDRPAGPLTVETPVFMPVGTRASVKALWQEDLEEIGYDLILGNTYHLYLRPGDVIPEIGGLRKFMAWGGAILTDSGGYQAFSLGANAEYLAEGVRFASHIDGSRHLFTPESVVDIQLGLGSDVMMVLDDCAPAGADPARLRQALDRTRDWAVASWRHYERRREEESALDERSKLFGIIQGGVDPELRRESAEQIQSQPFHGVAVGGLSVGETRAAMYATLESMAPVLDPARPRYLMGVGTIPDFLEAVRCGFDMFDCVLPTRNARNGQLLTSRGPLNLRNARFARAAEPPDPACGCRVCRRYSLAYLRHLFSVGEMLGPQMATYHNLHFYYTFMADLRAAVRENRFLEFYAAWKKISF